LVELAVQACGVRQFKQNITEDVSTKLFSAIHIDPASASENSKNHSPDSKSLEDLNVFYHHLQFRSGVKKISSARANHSLQDVRRDTEDGDVRCVSVRYRDKLI